MPKLRVEAQRKLSGKKALIIHDGILRVPLPDDFTKIALPYRIIGSVNHNGTRLNESIPFRFPFLGPLEELEEIVKRESVDAIILPGTGPVDPDLGSALARCGSLGVELRTLPGIYEEATGKALLSPTDHGWFVSQVAGTTDSPPYLVIKRILDVVFSSIALSAFSLLLPFIAAGIRLSSPGSIFIRQDRVGKSGKLLKMWKLRTMIWDAEGDGQPVWAQADDKRVTSFGKFLRRTKLDEVPQFWNVLKGEMSIVGPRPERPYFVEQLETSVPYYGWRHSIKPGITGWAQIHQGYASSEEESFEKSRYDLFYLKRRGILMDFLILAKTIPVVLRGKGSR
ncbi:MAG: exopolysaccharide biosynthesis polyprenyl glycosylphosphotransferase [Candidatus Eisenbacteria bacterium]|nr:exopolysaccharide biosynthesis polyprenyl glycosylphosphotransferase [Candidatus Eisenbacteria bacterium]